MKTNFTFRNFNVKYKLLLMAFVVACTMPALAQTKHVVEVSSNVFTPDELTIEAGDTVEWVNIGGFHNVNGTQATYPSNPEYFGNNTGNGWTYSYVFNTAGEYDYQCDPHVELGMTGEITVIEANEDFTLTVSFSEMTPHVGQNLWIAVAEKMSGDIVAREMTNISSASFALEFSGIEMDHSYNVDFFADFNENGMYDAPGDDHAWRLDLDNVTGDTTLMFEHNTNFTDIMWENELTVYFTGMTPHLGQDLWLAVIDENTGMEVNRVHALIEDAEFMVHAYGIESNTSYYVDFFVDFNENGMYDAPGDDHAWRLNLDDVMGDTTLMFEHNTNFTDIMWENRLSVHFTGMTPHVGQNLWLAVVDQSSGMEVDRVKATVEEDFMIHAHGIETGESYYVDFFVDFNENGSYDAPPADHAWRLELNSVMGDTTLMFAHNTDFTDIMWEHELTVQFTSMTPHIGQLLKLYVVDMEDGLIKDSVTISQVAAADFEVESFSLVKGHSYYVNFFADFNLNGSYDIPPLDHAWQLILNDVEGDTTLMFEHNTSFTDIFNATSIGDDDLAQLRMYPNPAKEKLWIESGDLNSEIDLAIYDITGKLFDVERKTVGSQIELDVKNLKQGIYLIELKTPSENKMLKFIKE